jgi:hypothetical protein
LEKKLKKAISMKESFITMIKKYIVDRSTMAASMGMEFRSILIKELLVKEIFNMAKKMGFLECRKKEKIMKDN